jgi:hypothetical protein
VSRLLQQAMQLSVAQAAAAGGDADAADYNNELRTGILEAYSGLFQVGPVANAAGGLCGRPSRQGREAGAVRASLLALNRGRKIPVPPSPRRRACPPALRPTG